MDPKNNSLTVPPIHAPPRPAPPPAPWEGASRTLAQVYSGNVGTGCPRQPSKNRNKKKHMHVYTACVQHLSVEVKRVLLHFLELQIRRRFRGSFLLFRLRGGVGRSPQSSPVRPTNDPCHTTDTETRTREFARKQRRRWPAAQSWKDRSGQDEKAGQGEA